jgi:LytS/YehU family sensor histidine kinase
MNPHLLFNALNTIASMIPENPTAAEEVTLRLSELYRGVLESSRRPVHRLDEELDICRAYLAIEGSRFGERLRSEIRVDDPVRARATEIPALLLQPLVENAVRHGLAPKALGGTIWIEVETGQPLVIRIGDDGVGLGHAKSTRGAGTGVANCRARIALRYGEQGQFEIGPRNGGGTQVEIRIPREHAAGGERAQGAPS